MKVVHVVKGLGWTGGVQEYVAGLSRGLLETGHEVVILAGGQAPPAGPAPHVLADGLQIVWHPKRRLFGRYVYPTGIWSSLRTYGRSADVVHVHQPFFLGTWMALTTRSRIAATIYLHPEDLSGSGRRFVLRRLLLRLLLTRVDLVVAVSEAEQNLIRTVGRPRRSGVVWPALVDRPADVDTTGDESDSGEGRPLVLSVGRLSVTKGVELMLRSFALLSNGIQVAMVGDGPDRDLVEGVCAEVGFDPEEILRGGSLTDCEVDELLRQATVFVSASTQESFGITVLKAIAYGCRPVVCDIPSHREIVTGLGVDSAVLFNAGIDPRDLAELIEAAVSEGRSGPTVSDRVPVWADSAGRLVDLYSTLSNRQGSGGKTR